MHGHQTPSLMMMYVCFMYTTLHIYEFTMCDIHHKNIFHGDNFLKLLIWFIQSYSCLHREGGRGWATGNRYGFEVHSVVSYLHMCMHPGAASNKPGAFKNTVSSKPNKYHIEGNFGEH